MTLLRIKQYVLGVMGRLTNDGRLSFTLSYIHNRHKLPHFSNPKDLSEIWISRVLNGKVNEIFYLADKYAVRKYVEEKGMGYILTPLIGVFQDPEQIDFSQLPNRFALKANFGAGMNIICTDKETIDEETAKRLMSQWMQPQVYSYSERHYSLIEKRIVCEEFIDDGTGGFPVDYKFMCIRGQIACILACSGREKGHAEYLPYSTDWKPLYEYYRKVSHDMELVPKPENLQEMLQVAKTLAGDIELVRVDLYSNGSRIWFGEMTLTPAGCIFHRWSQYSLDVMGAMYHKNIV